MRKRFDNEYRIFKDSSGYSVRWTEYPDRIYHAIIEDQSYEGLRSKVLKIVGAFGREVVEK